MVLIPSEARGGIAALTFAAVVVLAPSLEGWGFHLGSRAYEVHW
jgi:hypothetical protein